MRVCVRANGLWAKDCALLEECLFDQPCLATARASVCVILTELPTSFRGLAWSAELHAIARVSQARLINTNSACTCCLGKHSILKGLLVSQAFVDASGKTSFGLLFNKTIAWPWNYEYVHLACYSSTSAHGFDAGYVGLSLLSFSSTRIGRVVCCSPRFVTR